MLQIAIILRLPRTVEKLKFWDNPWEWHKIAIFLALSGRPRRMGLGTPDHTQCRAHEFLALRGTKGAG
jgi:hypothetical protein